MAPKEKTEDEKLAGMLAIHAKMTRQWKASKFYAGQKEWLEKTIFPLRLVVDSAIFMGTGRIAGNPNGSWKYDDKYSDEDDEDHGLHNLSQLVAFECWIDILRQKYHIAADKVYFQEPEFIDLEKEFITSLGHTVLEHPQAYEILTRRTFLCSSRLFKDVVAGCFSAAMPDLAVMSPLWIDSWVTGLKYRRKDYHRIRRTIKRYASSHLSQKQGPLFERNQDSDQQNLSIDRLMHSWLQDSEWYWSPDDPNVIGDIGEPMDEEEWRFLPGIYGVRDTYGAGIEYMEAQLKSIRRRREEEPLEEITSGSEYDWKDVEGGWIEEDEVVYEKTILAPPLQRLRKLRAYRVRDLGKGALYGNV